MDLKVTTACTAKSVSRKIRVYYTSIRKNGSNWFLLTKDIHLLTQSRSVKLKMYKKSNTFLFTPSSNYTSKLTQKKICIWPLTTANINLRPHPHSEDKRMSIKPLSTVSNAVLNSKCLINSIFYHPSGLYISTEHSRFLLKDSLWLK